MNSVSKKRTLSAKKRMTAHQKEGLVYFMEQHPQLVSGKFSSSFSYNKAQELWDKYATELNAHGPAKSALEWKKSWQDIRLKAKNAKAENARSILKTGGGEPDAEELTPTKDRIMAITGGDLIVSGNDKIPVFGLKEPVSDDDIEVLGIESVLSENDCSLPSNAVPATSPVVFSDNGNTNEIFGTFAAKVEPPSTTFTEIRASTSTRTCTTPKIPFKVLKSETITRTCATPTVPFKILGGETNTGKLPTLKSSNNSQEQSGEHPRNERPKRAVSRRIVNEVPQRMRDQAEATWAQVKALNAQTDAIHAQTAVLASLNNTIRELMNKYAF